MPERAVVKRFGEGNARDDSRRGGLNGLQLFLCRPIPPRSLHPFVLTLKPWNEHLLLFLSTARR
jgi:hypothetical protein